MMDAATPVRFALDEIEVAMLEDGGFCIFCGEPSETPVEPDARDYHCTACDRHGVYGAEELLLMDLVD